MRSLVLYYCYTLALLFSPSLQAGFSEPKYQIPRDSGKYAGNDVWVLGSRHEVIFDTPWPEYRIELWQQLEFASRGIKSDQNVYTQSSGEDLPQSFNWTVTTNELKLSDTPIFFFWMREVNESNPKPSSASSAFFNITEEAPTSSSSSSPSSITSSPSTSATSATSTSLTTSETSVTSMTSEPTSNPTSEPDTAESSSGLSTGAKAGIGAGIAVSGLIAIICAGLLWRTKHKNRQASQAAMQQQQQYYAYYPQQGEIPKHGGGPPTEAPTERPTIVGSESVHSELPGHEYRMMTRSPPVELDAGNR